MERTGLMLLRKQLHFPVMMLPHLVVQEETEAIPTLYLQIYWTKMGSSKTLDSKDIKGGSI